MTKKTKSPVPFLVIVFVKPKSDGIAKYGGKSYKGFCMALNSEQAKELATLAILEAFKDHDGSSVTLPIVNRDVIKVKSCILADDFFCTPESFKQTEKSE